MAVKRGCGDRQQAGVYACTRLGTQGMPLEYFMVDPPVPVNPLALGLSAIGVKVLTDPKTGIAHVWNWVGAQHYINPCDFIEEGRRFGFSTRMELSAADYAKLGPNSRIIHVHARAIIAARRADFTADRVLYRAGQREPYCPKGLPEHRGRDFPCLGLTWENVERGEPVLDPTLPRRVVERTVGVTVYRAAHRPFASPDGDDLIPAPPTLPAVFLRLPLHGIEVVRDRSEQRGHEAKLLKLKGTRLPVRVEDE